jgi:hypothetical protein
MGRAVEMVTRLLGLGILLAALCPQVAAQDTTGATQSIDFKNTDLQTALSTVTQRYTAKVICQEGAKGSVTAKAANATIETALTMITAPNNLAWREFILAVKPADQVNAKTLEELVGALKAIKFAGLVAYEPDQTEGVHFERAIPPGGLVGTPGPDGSKYTAFYYVYDPRARAQETKPAGETREIRDTRSTHPPTAPEQQANMSTAQVMQWFATLAPEMKARMIDELIRATEQETGGPGGRRGGPGRRRGPGGPDDQPQEPDE